MLTGIPKALRRIPTQLRPNASPFPAVITTTFFTSNRRTLAQARPDNDIAINTAFTSTPPFQQEPDLGPRSQPDHRPPDERTLKLGKTLRILQSRLPNLLASPLPQEILSPHITLHLFPSTHPHLPTVSGRVAYHAALWTSPITWGRVPLVGNVNLNILSERMVKRPTFSHAPYPTSNSGHTHNEKLIVRWRTCGKVKGLGVGERYKGIGARQRVDKITEWLGGDAPRDDEEFCGLFIFEFDEEGRVLNHVIERAEGGENWDNGVGSRVVGLTDWLLGKFGGKERSVEGLALGYVETGDGSGRIGGDKRDM